MTARLIVSHDNHQRLELASRWLGERGAAGLVTIVGSNRHAPDDLARRAALAFGASFGWIRTTPAQLAAELAAPELARLQRAPIGGTAVEALVAHVLHDLRREGVLGVFERIEGAPGLARALSATIAELRHAAVGVAALGEVAPELSQVLLRYEQELVNSAFADRAEILKIAAELISSAEYSHAWLDQPLLLLDVAVASEREQELVRALVSRSNEVLCTCPAADSVSLGRLTAALGGADPQLGSAVVDSGPARLSHQLPTASADGHAPQGRTPSPVLNILSSMPPGASVRAPLRHTPLHALATKPGEKGGLARLQRHLFEQHGSPESQPDDTVTVLSAPGEARECVEIARRISALARGGGRFDRIAIALRSPEEYVAHFEEALGRAEIPAYFSRGVVRPHPAGRAFIALLDCAAEGLSALRFAEYLSLGQVPEAGVASDSAERAQGVLSQELVPEALRQEAAAESFDEGTVEDPSSRAVIGGNVRAPRRWEKLLSEAAVIGGLDRWQRRLDAAEGALSEAIEGRQGLPEQDDPDDPARDRLVADLAALRELRRFAMPLLEMMAHWPDRGSWGEWLGRLRDLAGAALRRPASVLEVLAELSPMADVGPVALADVRLVLSRRLLAVSISPPCSAYGRVFVAPIEALRGLSFDVVFVPGMAERLFPRKIAEDPLLLDRARRAADQRLTTNEDRLVEERLLLRLAVAAAHRQVVLSYPRLDLAQGRPRVPSFYALEALRAAEGRLPSFDELSARAERETEARVGWPAPLHPADAIDEAEHDLALLENLRSRDEQEKVGTARYLLTANPHLGRALRFRARRWLKGWTPADGLVRPSKSAMEVIRAHHFDARSFSPTALEKYANCPYQFFLYAIHRFSPREVADVVDDLDPLRRGSLVHETQFDLFERLRDEELLPVRPENLERVRDILDQCLDSQAARLRDRLLPRIERVWQDAVETIRADLREWLRRLSVDESGYVPWRFELAFGLPAAAGRDENSVEEPVELDCGIRLRGSIDLVERHRDGRLRATDHKTGKARMPARGVIAGGTGLQPVLYALAVEKLSPGATVDGGRLYYCTSTGAFEEREIALDASARQSANEVGRIIGEALETPFLPARPSRGACQWCDYRVVCGPYEEQRTGRKAGKGVEGLEYLRSLP